MEQITAETLEAMGKGDMVALVRDAADDVLPTIFAYAKKEQERSLLAALFLRGYVSPEAVETYASYNIISPTSMARLDDDTIIAYMKGLAAQKTGWYVAAQVLDSGWWQRAYPLILQRRPKLLQATLSLEDGEIPHRGQYFAYVARTVKPDQVTGEMALRIWPYATNKQAYTRYIDHATRLELYKKRPHKYRSDVWLYDATVEEVRGMMLEGVDLDRNTLVRAFGMVWATCLWNPEYDLEDVPMATRTTFLASLTADDMEFLEQIKWHDHFAACLEMDAAKAYGLQAWVKAHWDVCPLSVRVWLASYLPSNFVRGCYSGDMEPEVLAMVMDVEEQRYEQHMLCLLDCEYGDGRTAPVQHWALIAAHAPTNELYPFYRGVRERAATTGMSYMSWEDIRYLVAYHAPESDVAEFIAEHPVWRWRDRLLDICLERVGKEYASQVEAAAPHPKVDAWLVKNSTPTRLLALLTAGRLDDVVVDACKRVDPADVTTALAYVEGTDLGDDQLEALKTLVRRAPCSDVYMQHSVPEVKRAAAKRASKDVLLAALRSDTEPLIEDTFRRDDLDANAVEYITAYFENPLGPNSVNYSSAFAKALDGFDRCAHTLDQPTFVGCVEFILQYRSLACVPFRYNTLHRLYKMGDGALLARVLDSGYATASRVPQTEALIKRYTVADMAAIYDVGVSNSQPILADMGKNGLEMMGRNKEWVCTLSRSDLKAIARVCTSWGSRYAAKNELNRRDNREREVLAAELDETYLTGNGYLEAVTAAVSSGVEWKVDAGLSSLMGTLRAPDGYDLVPDLSVVCVRELYRVYWDDSALMVALVSQCSDDVWGKMWPVWLARLYEECQQQGREYRTRRTATKAAMVARCDVKQSITYLHYFFSAQRGMFDARIQSAFLDKLDDDDFCAALKTYLLSDDFNLRMKQFTLEMVPFVVGLDDCGVRNYFNRSRRFTGHHIGGPVAEWDNLTTDADRKAYLDKCRSRTLIALLKGLIDRVVPLRSPVDEALTIGTNDPAQLKELMGDLNVSSKQVTHLALLRIAIQSADDDQLRAWILENPFKAFDGVSVTDVESYPLRLDTISAEEDKEVRDHFIAAWEGSGRNLKHDIKGIYAVRCENTDTWEPPSGDAANVKKHLYHGTTISAVPLILRNHFKVMVRANNGRAFGDGVYFADCGSKAAQYMSGKNGRWDCQGVMFICEVDLGKCLDLKPGNDGGGSWSGGALRTKWHTQGYDSCHWPKRGTLEDHPQYGGNDAEYIVRDVKRIRIKYVIHLGRKRGY